VIACHEAGHALVDGLLEHEPLSKEEIDEILGSESGSVTEEAEVSEVKKVGNV
jgi:hypothetical protein